MLVDSIAEKKDFWLVYEVCKGQTMNEHCFNVKGEFFKGERIYMVHHSNFYKDIRNNFQLLKEFLIRMCSVLNVLATLNIVHADLKPDNIIIDYDEQTQSIKALKVIDFGSAFLLTPEGHVLEHQ